MCSTARPSVVLIGSPRNIASIFSGRSNARARPYSKSSDSRRDALARDIEQPRIGIRGGSAASAAASLRDEFAQVHLRPSAPHAAPTPPRPGLSELKVAHGCCVLRRRVAGGVQDTIRRNGAHRRFEFGARSIADIVRQGLDVGPGIGDIAAAASAGNSSVPCARGIVPALRYSAAARRAFGCRCCKSGTARRWCSDSAHRNPKRVRRRPHDRRPRSRP